MLSTNNINNLPGLNIIRFKNNDLNLIGILPLIAEEFPSWGLDRLKSYIRLVLKQDSNGILVAKNDSSYNVGLLIYSIQDIINKGFSKNTKKEFSKCLVVENLISSSPVLEKKVFLQLTNKAVDIAENNSCEIVELPRFNTSFDLVKKKYKKNIINFNGWRTFIKIDKILTANKEL
ncbi:hypothetical protein ACIJYB_05880 [Candidatus Pelagibacter bacterium nBUS_44]|uniref:hypothetical protein n=1 Tax=Candidatus Pelagibacter bacterium nBUS_44 TaxID=3374195 RepID=UPI003EBCBEDF